MEQTTEPCPQCQHPMTRVEIEDLTDVLEQTPWTKRFADPEANLLPGRYRCAECISEWWQFPATLAS